MIIIIIMMKIIIMIMITTIIIKYRKDQGRRSTSPQSALHRAFSNYNIESLSNGPPLPIELDVESANGKKLMAAVCGFSATMAAHLET